MSPSCQIVNGPKRVEDNFLTIPENALSNSTVSIFNTGKQVSDNEPKAEAFVKFYTRTVLLLSKLATSDYTL